MEEQDNKSPRLRVLIADDSQEMRRGTRLMLSLNPAVKVIAIAQDGRQAVELAKRHKPEIAIVDVNMPEMDGLSTIKTMMAFNPDMGCIVISVEHESQTLRDAMSSGAREYLVKPFTADELNQAVERVSQAVLTNRQRIEMIKELSTQRKLYLERLADEYIKARRKDELAVEVFEQLADNPDCDMRWLMGLAMLYLLRQEWGKLKALADRLEKGNS